jgi:hypothetical protein
VAHGLLVCSNFFVRWNEMKRALMASAVVVGLMSAGAAHADVGPAPNGWTCSGNCGTDGADGDIGLSPLNDPYYEYVSTNGGINGVGVNPTGATNPTNGSLLQTSQFNATQNTSLNFYFNFIKSDGGTFADNAWAALFKADGTFVTDLYSSTTGSTAYTQGLSNVSWLGSSSGMCYQGGCGSTGWQQVNYTINDAGDYYMAFGATNSDDTAYDTGLAIDGLTVGGQQVQTDVTNTADVPEPASIVVLGAALAGLGLARRRMTS